MKFKKTYNWNKIKTAKDALIWSIAKWQLLHTEGHVIEIGKRSCACCKLYFLISCDKCPIYNQTEVKICKETPFNVAYDNLVGNCENNYPKKYSKQERDFLIKVYESNFGKFSITGFKAGPYKQMRKYLLEKFSTHFSTQHDIPG